MENKFISVVLAKKLHDVGCKLPADEMWCTMWKRGGYEPSTPDRRMSSDERDSTRCYVPETEFKSCYNCYDILNDICCKYAKEFFGEEEIDDWNGDCDTYIEDNSEPAYQYHTSIILCLMRQRKKQEAEDYIWENCLFNNIN